MANPPRSRCSDEAVPSQDLGNVSVVGTDSKIRHLSRGSGLSAEGIEARHQGS